MEPELPTRPLGTLEVRWGGLKKKVPKVTRRLVVLVLLVVLVGLWAGRSFGPEWAVVSVAQGAGSFTHLVPS